MAKPKYKLSEDKEQVKLIREGLKAKAGYCPCMVERSKENKCPCAAYRAGNGCHCGLYVE